MGPVKITSVAEQGVDLFGRFRIGFLFGFPRVGIVGIDVDFHAHTKCAWEICSAYQQSLASNDEDTVGIEVIRDGPDSPF